MTSFDFRIVIFLFKGKPVCIPYACIPDYSIIVFPKLECKQQWLPKLLGDKIISYGKTRKHKANCFLCIHL